MIAYPTLFRWRRYPKGQPLIINIKLLIIQTRRVNIMRQVIIYPGEDGYWVAECPSLPGCISQGQTREEAVKNIREAIQGYIAALEGDGLIVPEEKFEAILIAV
jgi:predicted RNase H-like HicB family nuclease